MVYFHDTRLTLDVRERVCVCVYLYVGIHHYVYYVNLCTYI